GEGEVEDAVINSSESDGVERSWRKAQVKNCWGGFGDSESAVSGMGGCERVVWARLIGLWSFVLYPDNERLAKMDTGLFAGIIGSCLLFTERRLRDSVPPGLYRVLGSLRTFVRSFGDVRWALLANATHPKWHLIYLY
ncbi:hypothetical protein Tco_0713937, partial [Tanacetum coccineum]